MPPQITCAWIRVLALSVTTLWSTPGAAFSSLMQMGLMYQAPAAGAGFRYYRFRPTSEHHNTNGYTFIYELQFQWNGSWQTNAMTASGVGTIGGYSATVTNSSEFSASYSGWKCFDGDTTSNNGWNTAADTYLKDGVNNETTTNWVKVDFGVGASPQITGVNFRGFNDQTYPDEFHLEGSNDDSAWTTIVGSSFTAANTTALAGWSMVAFTWAWAN